MKQIFPILFLALLLANCKTKKNVTSSASVAEIEVGFYNVENLFDTLDHPVKFDEEFTPSGKKKYTTERYFKKLDNLSKVVEAMGMPAILGVCEVENKTVLQDLAATDRMKKYNYAVVHFESPDKRGIDNALMYQTDKFDFKGSKILRFKFPDEIAKDYTSRDVLIVAGEIAGQKIHFLVNHFPSRRGGLAASEPKRVFVAEKVKAAVDSLHAMGSSVLLMGDFNDETDNKSIKEVLCEGGGSDASLFNLFAEKDAAGEGTYNYKGNWNMLDQVLVSSKMTSPKNSIFASEPTIVREEWMMYQDKKHGAKPNRSYGGPNWYGGYSDHLPVKVTLRVGE